MTHSRLPRSLEELNPEFVRSVLREGDVDPGPIMGFRWDRIGEGQGMMGDVGRVHWLTSESTSEETLIAKLPALHRGNRAQGELLGLYEREVRFYRELAARVGYRTPRHLGSALAPRPDPDPEAGHRLGRLPDWAIYLLAGLGLFLAGRIYRGAVLFLEDLSHAETGDQLDTLGDARLEAILVAMARAHAASWGSAELDEIPWLPRADSAPELLGAFFRRARKPFLQSFRTKVSDEVLALADRANELVTEVTGELSAAPRTLLHGDLRVDNLFFDGTGSGDVIFTDWQVLARGKGVYDLAYFLSGTLEPEVSADDEESWVRIYHDALLAARVRDYDLSRCLADYRIALLQMLPRVFTASATVDFSNPRGTRLQHHWLDRLVARIEAQPIGSWHAALDGLQGSRGAGNARRGLRLD